MVRCLTSDVLFWLVLTCCFTQIFGNNDCGPQRICQNGGTCGQGNKCECTDGWGGHFCTKVNVDCNGADPCVNGGTCTPEGNGQDQVHTCACRDGFSGRTCETAICEPPCVVGQGVCETENGATFCRCEFGYFGVSCNISEVDNIKCGKPLGVQQPMRTIQDSQMIGSSQVNGDFRATYGRLLDGRAWCGMPNDVNGYLQINLLEMTYVAGLEMQGDSYGLNYVTQFSINATETSSGVWMRKMVLNNYQTHPNMINKHLLHPSVLAVQFRVVVEAFIGLFPCMRIELYGCTIASAQLSPANCFLTLGIKNGGPFQIRNLFGNTDISTHLPHMARLDRQSSWCTTNTSHPTLGVFVSQTTTEIVGIITQGNHLLGRDSYVTAYKVEEKGGGLTKSISAGGQKILSGNHNPQQYVTHFFDKPIRMYDSAMSVLIKPQTFNNMACMRIELISCDNRPQSCLSHPCLNGGTCERTTNGFVCTCREGFSGDTCETYKGRCDDNVMDSPHKAVFSSMKEGFDDYKINSTGAWCTADHNNAWIKLEFVHVIKVYAVGVGAPHDTSILSFPRNFRVVVQAVDGGWIAVKVGHNEHLEGIKKPGDVVLYYINTPREVRVVKFELHNQAGTPKCALVDIRGCVIVPDHCADNEPCMNGGTCINSDQHSYYCYCPLGYEGRNCQHATKISCVPSLGVYSETRIPDTSITADGFITGYEPKYVRIIGDNNAFCDSAENQPTLTITFGSPTLVLGIKMKGHPTEDNWVTKFQLHVAGTWRDLTGNVHPRKGVFHSFFNNETVLAFEIKPIESNGKKCMELDLYGINDETLSHFKMRAPSRVPDSQISAGSFTVGNEPHKARLNRPGWCSAEENPSSEFLLIDAGKFYKIEIIVTKGGVRSEATNAWVKSYHLYHSYVNTTWKEAKMKDGIGIFSGNLDHETAQYHFFEQPLFAKLLKIVPIERDGWMCMRFDFFGCEFDPCEHCNRTISYCNETTSWTCKCFEESVCQVSNDSLYANNSVAASGNLGVGTESSSMSKVPSALPSPTPTLMSMPSISHYPVPRNIGHSTTITVSSTSSINEPVHGNWTTWSSWSDCSVTCGSGVFQRTRNCSNPEPAFGGDNCFGVDKQIGDCDGGTLCPGEGGYSEWSPWLPCNNTCGSAFQNRKRTCENEASGCTAESKQSKPCAVPPCPVDGGYTEWGNWSACSVTCSTGQRIRTRECTNPAPAHGGAECAEPAEQTLVCTLPLCAAEFGFGGWTAWSTCTETCGPGRHSRSRRCTMLDPGDQFCQGAYNQTEECLIVHCPIDGQYSDWGGWSACPRTCGFAQKKRGRNCTNPAPQYGGNECVGRKREFQDCENRECPGNQGYTDWSSWTPCSVTCGVGTESRTRFCRDQSGSGCAGSAVETKSCLKEPCPINGNFTEWSEWSICSVTCGTGQIHRTRECSNPEPAYNGSDCFGLTREDQYCSVPNPCSHEAGFSVWSPWSPCSAQCSFGESTRERTCTDPTKETCVGATSQNISCDSGPCPINGGYSDWLPWTACSGYCGSGLKTRSRTCSNPEPAFDGAPCSGPSEETQDCEHSTQCTGASGYGEWTQWTLCTQTCGSSVQIRTRQCNEGVDPNECSDPSSQSKPCDKGPCPVHGNWAAWSNWGACSSSCDSGVKQRSRTCTNPVPSYGGLSCFENSHDYQACVMPQECPGLSMPISVFCRRIY